MVENDLSAHGAESAEQTPSEPLSLEELQESRQLAARDGDPLAALLAGEHRRRWQAVLQAIPAENRLAIVLHVVEDFTCVDLAELFGVPLTTIEGTRASRESPIKTPA